MPKKLVLGVMLRASCFMTILTKRGKSEMGFLISESKKRNVIVYLLFAVYLLASITVYAQQNYTTSAELFCDNVKVQVVTKCVDDSYLSFPFCVEQRFIFTDQKTNKTYNISASGKIVAQVDSRNRKIGEVLDYLAVSMASVKGKTKSYLLVRYYNGGNCGECEWYEIYDLNGSRLATSRGKVTGIKYKNFENVYKQIGLPEQWPRLLFIDIPLSRKNKEFIK